MMDLNLIFDGTPPNTGVAITATATSTNSLDFGVARDMGSGTPLAIHVDVLQAFAAAGAATLQISCQGSDDNATWLDMVFSPVIAKANLIVGAKLFRYPLPMFQLNKTTKPPRYLQLNYTVATGPFTAGTVMSYITPLDDRDQYYTYPRNFSISA